jgi:hypothetical protein
MATEVEIDRDVLALAVLFGLAEWRDDCWQATEKGNKAIRGYLDREIADERETA